MSKKNNKKDEPIGLDIELSKSEAFIEKHLKTILYVLVAVIVVVAGIFIYRNHMKSVELEAQNAIAKSQTAFAQEQYDQALKGDGANEKGLLKIIDDYSGTKTANLAKLYAAICYANLGKTDEAIKYFEGYDQQNDQMISPVSLAALGNCYVKKGNTQKGIDLLLKAAKKADNDAVSPVCLLQAGELYESINQNDKAVEVYQQIKDKYFRSPLSAEMDKYIERATK